MWTAETELAPDLSKQLKKQSVVNIKKLRV